jgi:DNA-binding LacI/PurR family transcriptional regulator
LKTPDVKGKAITIKDIAKLLGVSVSTVSRALKDHPDISHETRDAVKAVAQSMNYRPSQVAVSLRLKQSKVIGVLLPKIYSFFFPSVINGIEEVVNEHGYHLMILQSNELYQKEIDNTNILLVNNVEGVLATVSRQTRDFSHFENILDAGIPMVFFDRVPDNVMADMVLIDDTEGAYKAVKHLIERGRRKIAICIGNPEMLISVNRLKGYKKALEEFNIPFNEDYLVAAETPEIAAAKTARLLGLKRAPDSIFAISDLTMSGIVQEIYKRKIKVPEEIALIGFCEDTFCKMYNPQLSSITPLGLEIGRQAARRLFLRIFSSNNQSIKPQTIFLNSRLEIRDST